MSPSRRAPSPLGPDVQSVSPVIGTILLMGIFATVIAATLLASGPLLDRLQGQAAAEGVLGDVIDVRDASLALGGPDSHRTATLTVPRGTAAIGPQGAMLLIYDTNADGATACDMRVTGWDDPSSTAIDIDASSCAIQPDAGGDCTVACVDAARVLGGSVQSVTTTWTAPTLTLSTGTLGTDDWRFRFHTTTGGVTTTYAEAWLVRSDALAWDDETTGASVDAWLGFVLSARSGTTFADRPFPFETQPSGGLQVVRLVSFKGDPPSATNAQGSHAVGLRLVDRALRADADGATSLATHLRFEFSGDLSRQACLAMAFRDLDPVGGEYREDAALPCAGAQSVKAIDYDTDAAAPATDTFSLEVSHARIRVHLD